MRRAHVSRDKHVPSKFSSLQFKFGKRSPTQIMRQLMTVKCLTPLHRTLSTNDKYFAGNWFECDCTAEERVHRTLRNTQSFTTNPENERKFTLFIVRIVDVLRHFLVVVSYVCFCRFSVLFGWAVSLNFNYYLRILFSILRICYCYYFWG